MRNPALNAERFRVAWLLRKEGATLKEVGRQLGVTQERARQILAQAERRMKWATEITYGPANDPIAYGVWHEFTADRGRIGLG